MYKEIAAAAIMNVICKFIVRGYQMIADFFHKSLFNKFLIDIVIN